MPNTEVFRTDSINASKPSNCSRSLNLSDTSSEVLIAEMHREPELDVMLRNKILLQNLSLILSSVERCRPSETAKGDCWSVGVRAMLRAISEFDSSRGVSFEAFARFKLDHEIRGHLATENEFGFGDSIMRNLRRFRRLAQDRDPDSLTDQEVSNALDTSIAVVRALRPFLCLVLRFGSEDEAGQTSFGCISEEMVAGEAPLPSDETAKRLDAAVIIGLLKKHLRPREWIILSSLYGLEGQRVVPPNEVAQILGISRARVDQITQEALKKFRHRFLEKEGLAA